VMLS